MVIVVVLVSGCTGCDGCTSCSGSVVALIVISLLTQEVNAAKNKYRNVRMCETGDPWEQDGTNGRGGISLEVFVHSVSFHYQQMCMHLWN